jgi:RimJ/RimL family protein N-acetyltransferase
MTEFDPVVYPSMALDLADKLQPEQKLVATLTPGNLYTLVKSGPAWAVKRDGAIVALAGYTELWPGRAVVWGYLGSNAGPSMSAMTRFMRAEMAKVHLVCPRVEAYADRHHPAAHRWLKLLGFKREGLMRKFAGGRDFALYARVV